MEAPTKQLVRKILILFGVAALVVAMGGLGLMLKSGWPGPPDWVIAAALLGCASLWLAGELKD